MELKRWLVVRKPYRLAGFNRTFMELKLGNQEGIWYQPVVLIAPLWN